MAVSAITTSSATATRGAHAPASRHIGTNSENSFSPSVGETPFEYSDFDPWSSPGVRWGYNQIVRSETTRATTGDGTITLRRWDKKSNKFLPKNVSFSRDDTDVEYYLREFANLSDEQIKLLLQGPSTLSPANSIKRSNILLSLSEECYYEYSEVVGGFMNYLFRTKNAYLGFDYIDTVKNVVGRRYMKYVHRWSDEYRKKLIAKLYAIDAGLKDLYGYNKSLDVTLITLTSYQDGEYSEKCVGKRLSREESLARLNEGYGWLIDTIRKITKTAPYLGVLEPHWTGYGHIHLVIFAKLSEDDKRRLGRLWSEKYGIGSRAHGIDIQDVRTKTIRNLTNYLMKYLTKSFFNGDTGTQYADPADRWSPGELLFNAIVWYSGKKGVKRYRFLLPSREISRMMRGDNVDYEHVERTRRYFTFASWKYRMLRTRRDIRARDGETVHRTDDVVTIGKTFWHTDDPAEFYRLYSGLPEEEKEKIDFDTLQAIVGGVSSKPRRDTELGWYMGGRSDVPPDDVPPDDVPPDDVPPDDVPPDDLDTDTCREHLIAIHRAYRAGLQSERATRPTSSRS